MKTNKLFASAIFAVLLFAASHATAQVDFTPVFTKFKLEARGDFDYFHNTASVAGTTMPTDDIYGFHGKYFNLLLGGNLSDHFSYYFRERIVAKPGTVNLFDNTDFLYLNYTPNEHWMIRLGKDALAVGGFEYDAPPIDVLFSTHYWDNFYCFQLAAAAAYKFGDGNQMVLAQIGNSPYVYYGAALGTGLGSEWTSGLLSYNLFWSGTFGHFKTLYSVNMFERPDHGYMNYIALGHKLVYDRWDIYLDLMHHALASDDWMNNFGIVSCMNFLLTPDLNLFVKGAYEQNRSGEVLPFGSTAFDCLLEPYHSYTLYGIGFEYRPAKCKDVRIHGFVANHQSVADHLADQLDPKTERVENSLNMNIGITWDMDIHKMFRERQVNLNL